MKNFIRFFWISGFALFVSVNSVFASAVVRVGAGVNPAAIQAAVDQFRADLGGTNNGRQFIYQRQTRD
jgi:hypothetical protein